MSPYGNLLFANCYVRTCWAHINLCWVIILHYTMFCACIATNTGHHWLTTGVVWTLPKVLFFCLSFVQGGGSSKSGKSLKGVSKKSIFASPESIQGKVSCGFFKDCCSSRLSFWSFYSKARWKNKVKFDDIILFRVATLILTKRTVRSKATYSVAETGARTETRTEEGKPGRLCPSLMFRSHFVQFCQKNIRSNFVEGLRSLKCLTQEAC